jgi:hypothetical protein
LRPEHAAADRAGRPGPRWTAALLACGLLLSLGLHVSRMRCLTTLVHDDGISYMAATGHQGAYQKDLPFDQWVPAGEWKRFWRPESFWCFQTIASDLRTYDIHPPLYFWGLHVWTYCFGTHLWSGPALNSVLFVVTFFVLFRLLREVFESDLPAGLAVFLWAVSPQVIDVAMNARQYSLLTLIAVGFAWALLRLVRPGPWSKLAMLVLPLCAAAGMMTQYQYFVVIAGGAALALLLVASRRIPPARAAAVILLLACGAALFWLLNPHFLEMMSRQRVGSQPFDAAVAHSRVKRVIAELAAFALPVAPHRRYALWAALCLLLPGILALRSIRADLRNRSAQGNPSPIAQLAFLGGSVAAGIIGMYVLFITPEHAMGARYLGAVFPFVAFGLVLALRTLPRQAACAAAAALCLWQVGASLNVALTSRADASAQFAAAVAWQPDTSTVLLDNITRGVVPGIVSHLPDHALVLASPQENLLTRPVILADRATRTVLYVTDNRYGNTRANFEKIRDRLIGEGFEVRDLECDMFGIGRVHKITRLARPD